jgi:hypothetical protein
MPHAQQFQLRESREGLGVGGEGVAAQEFCRDEVQCFLNFLFFLSNFAFLGVSVRV